MHLKSRKSKYNQNDIVDLSLCSCFQGNLICCSHCSYICLSHCTYTCDYLHNPWVFCRKSTTLLSPSVGRLQARGTSRTSLTFCRKGANTFFRMPKILFPTLCRMSTNSMNFLRCLTAFWLSVDLIKALLLSKTFTSSALFPWGSLHIWKLSCPS